MVPPINQFRCTFLRPEGAVLGSECLVSRTRETSRTVATGAVDIPGTRGSAWG